MLCNIPLFSIAASLSLRILPEFMVLYLYHISLHPFIQSPKCPLVFLAVAFCITVPKIYLNILSKSHCGSLAKVIGIFTAFKPENSRECTHWVDTFKADVLMVTFLHFGQSSPLMAKPYTTIRNSLSKYLAKLLSYYTLRIPLTYYLVRKYAVWDIANKNKMASFWSCLWKPQRPAASKKRERKKAERQTSSCLQRIK